MLDYQLQPNSRRCSVTGRELQPGETFYTVLYDDKGELTRRDHGAESWNGPPEDAYGYWSGVVPASDREKRPPVDDDLLMECFARLENEQEPAKVNFRYVLALLLMRRKRLRFEETIAEREQEILVVRCAQTKAIHKVANPNLSEEEMAAVRDEVLKVLGW